MKTVRVMFQFVWTFLVVTSFASALYASEGVGHGGGGGDMAENENPWFLGKKPIQYCVNIASDFPIEASRVRSTIREAFNDWKSTLSKYGFHGQPLNGTFSDGIARGITVDAVEVETCNDPDHQLEFKIGVVDEKVNAYFSKNPKRMVGFVERGAYDHKSFRTGGYIWIAPQNWIGPTANPVPNSVSDTITVFPDWTKKTRFKAFILHEIGHVFGFPHHRGTVMDEEIFDILFWDHVYCVPGYGCENAGNVPDLNGSVEPGVVFFDPFGSNAVTKIPYNVAAFFLKTVGAINHRSLGDFSGTTELSRSGAHAVVTWRVMAPNKRKFEFTGTMRSLNNGNGGHSQWLFYSPKYTSGRYSSSDTHREPLLWFQAYGQVFVGSVKVGNRNIPFSLALDRDQTTLFMNKNGTWTNGLHD